ncbi:hypothetical protein DXG03_006680 [Asterophora parasitica]|uniref:Uncharacterized protein n=1 Tax=Asterophora parasitica TaxID=117018 RepID=A0A9P7KAI4_9AGAR|nr:hypothetical protein DXG03_006680 [Asterophora parasitica]
MQFFTAVFAAIALAAPVFAGPAPLRAVEKFGGKTSGKYIVKLKEGVTKSKVFAQLKNSKVTHDWSVIHGFAGHLSDDAVNALRASPDVEYIAEDGIVTTFATQTNAPWGLSRISQKAKLANQNANALTFSYTYDNSAGSGVDVYVVGEYPISLTCMTSLTRAAVQILVSLMLFYFWQKPDFRCAPQGVYTAHSTFGGRARWGATFGGYPDADGNGHGTHVAGTVGGSQYGVAKAVSIIAVKVLGDDGSGSVTDIVDGLQWVSSAAAASGRPSIATLSLGGGASVPLDNAVTSLVNKGIHVTVAAGNDNVDAKNTSPARAAGVITVGASTIADARASFSNYGSVVDVFAPGLNVISSWIGSTTATNQISGTSMATPHVAGLVAYLVGKNGNSSPASITALLKSLSVKSILTGVPSGTANNLVQNA